MRRVVDPSRIKNKTCQRADDPRRDNGQPQTPTVLWVSSFRTKTSGVNHTKTGRRQRETTAVFSQETIMERQQSHTVNDVKEGSYKGTLSSGRGHHGPQVIPDRQQATGRIKNTFKLGTWNVQTMLQKGKLDNIKGEMKRTGTNILGVSEVRWNGAGKITSDGYIFIYSGGEKSERGVGIITDPVHSKTIKGYWTISDRVIITKFKGRPFDINVIQVYAPTNTRPEEEVDKFYEDLEKAKLQCKSQEVTIIQGDFNAKVGKGRREDVIGDYGLGEGNERGDRLYEWAKMNEMIIGNTWFRQHPRRLWTWKSPDYNTRNQIDYILIDKRFRNGVVNIKTLPGADCNSDHNLLVANIKIKLKRTTRAVKNLKLNLDLLKTDKDIKEKYTVAVQNRFTGLEEIQRVEQQWEKLKEAITLSAKEIIPTAKTTGKRKWMTTEILELMEKRRLAKQNKEQYKEIHTEIRKKCDLAKEEWLNKQCEEIEAELHKESKTMYKRIQEITGKKTSSKTGCIKSKDGNIIMERDQILERWSEYINDLFDDDRNEEPALQVAIEGPEILREEVENIISHMKRGKATGPDGISSEMILALEDMGTDVITRMLNTIYDTGDLPKDMLQSVFIALPKKQGATECEQHRTISLMSHVTKILLRIIMKRIRGKVYAEIADNQCGFIEGKGTVNAIYILRNIIERTLEVNKDLYVCFIDYTKAFDKVRHEELINILQQLNIDGKDLRIIKKIYWEQTAAVRVEEETSTFQKIKRGVRQGCVLSPDLFSLYSEMIMRHLDEIEGLKIGGHNINNLRYADDTVLLANSEENLKELLNKVIVESENKGLELNNKKTEAMIISRKKIVPKCKIQIKENKIRQVNTFRYLGTQITADGRCHQEIKSRIAQAKTTFQQMKPILTNIKLSMTVRKRILQAFVEPVLLYGCEAWTIDDRMKTSLEAVEMWFLRRMMRIPWTAKKTNEEVLRAAQHNKQLITRIRKRQAKFLGHTMRKNNLENLVTTGMLDGRRGRGRPREKMLDSLAKWMDTRKPSDMLNKTSCREGWRSMIAHASRQGT